MGSLGFRHPQFSEDLAWLPAWLPQHQCSESDEPRNQHNIIRELAIKDSEFLQGTIGEEKHGVYPSREEGQCKSFHLFLSGEDNSSDSFASSTGNVTHLRLHLSSDVDLQHHQSQLTSQAQYDFNKDVFMQQLEGSAASVDKTYLLAGDCNAGGIKALPQGSIPLTVEDILPNLLSIGKDTAKESAEDLNVRWPKGIDLTEAVELSVAASEALAIHELVNSEVGTNSWPTEAILEAALQIKEARLEGLRYTFASLFEETDTIDSLSDLDDLTMADSFDDVGLSYSGPDDQHVYSTDVSAVKATPMSGSFILEHIGDPAPAIKTSSSRTNVEFLHHQPSSKIVHVSPVSQGVSFAIMGTPFQSPMHAWNLDDDREDNISNQNSDSFRNCWLQDLKLQDAVVVPLHLKQSGAKCIMKPFAQETSFLSESADFAPDENSAVQKPQPGNKIKSQPSVPFEGFYDKADEGISTSQEVISSDLSMADPLCSVVPCSISSQPSGSPRTPDHIGHGDTGNVSVSISELGMGNLQKKSDLEVAYAQMDGLAVPKETGKSAESLVKRQLTSLRSYSTLMSKHDAIRNPNRGNPVGFFPLKSVSDCTVDKDNKDNSNHTIDKYQIEETQNEKKDYDELVKEGTAFQIQPLKEGMLHIFQDQVVCCSLKASKGSFCSSREINLELSASQENVDKVDQHKDPERTPSDCNGLGNTLVLGRKRVRFAEVEVEPQQDNSLRKLQVSEKNRFTRGYNKRRKCSNLWPDSQTLFMKRCVPYKENNQTRYIFQGIEFLLTGFSRGKEKEIEGLIQKYGGIILWEIPSPQSTIKGKKRPKSKFQQLPIVLCSKKLKSTKFLYGCAVNTFILKVKWLTDSVEAGSLVAPDKYLILSSHAYVSCVMTGKAVCHYNNKKIFDGVGILLHGKHILCTKLAVIVKHGGGRVFKSLQCLVQSLEDEKISVGTVVAEDENRASRHLRQCASERKIPMMPASWLLKSLHLGQLLPFKEKKFSPMTRSMLPLSIEWSQEI